MSSATNATSVKDNANLAFVREETEWEQCSRNPDVARLVKTRNLIERNRLAVVRSQLDRELERELKRLSLERKEFSDVLENLQRRRTESRQMNVRRSSKAPYSMMGMVSNRGKQDRMNRSGQWIAPTLSVKCVEPVSDPNRQTSSSSIQSEVDRASSHRGSLSSIMSLPELYRLATPHVLSTRRQPIKVPTVSKPQLEVPNSLSIPSRSSSDSMSNDTTPGTSSLS
ncbi:unnamed protein product [Echinostoma caproni]|uniref:CCDC92 domain-containing protein n=1 Tax=Echinostoma caproni TaxID=27848 RepID=A0A183AGQ1_9TREM|nr:unnamed protein product [Echinostoma caproni]